MPTIKEILADPENYGDDEEVTIKGVKVKVGDIRAFNASQNEAAAAALEERRTTLQNYENDLVQKADALAAQIAEIQANRGAERGSGDLVQDLINRLRGPEKKTMMDLDGDEFFGPVVKTIREFQAGREELAKEIKKYNEEASRIARWAVEREIDRDFNSLPDRPKELTKRQLVDHAVKRRYVDELGYPDLRRAYDDVQAPVFAKKSREQMRKEVEQEVRAEQQKKQAEPIGEGEIDQIVGKGHVFVPRPSGGSGGGKGAAAVKPTRYGGIEKIPTEAVLNDPSIRALFEQ